MNRRSLFKSIIGAAIAPQILDAESVAGKPGFLVGGTPYDPTKYLGTWRLVNMDMPRFNWNGKEWEMANPCSVSPPNPDYS